MAQSAKKNPLLKEITEAHKAQNIRIPLNTSIWIVDYYTIKGGLGKQMVGTYTSWVLQY